MSNILKLNIKERHKLANELLFKAADKYIQAKGSSEVFRNIALKAGCSDMTVRNYVQGRGSDGFVTEQLTLLFQKYKP